MTAREKRQLELINALTADRDKWKAMALELGKIGKTTVKYINDGSPLPNKCDPYWELDESLEKALSKLREMEETK